MSQETAFGKAAGSSPDKDNWFFLIVYPSGEMKVRQEWTHLDAAAGKVERGSKVSSVPDFMAADVPATVKAELQAIIAGINGPDLNLDLLERADPARWSVRDDYKSGLR